MQKLNSALLILLLMAVAYLFATRPKAETPHSFQDAEPMLVQPKDSSDVDHDGQLLGYKIRPEIAKMIMWREDGDLSLLYKVIKTSNYMNRLLLDY